MNHQIPAAIGLLFFASPALAQSFATDEITNTPGFGGIIGSGPAKFESSTIDGNLADLAADADAIDCNATTWAGTWVRGRSPRLQGATEGGGVVSGPSLTNGTVDGEGFSSSLASGGRVNGQTDDGNDLWGYFARVNSARSIWYGVEVDCVPPEPMITVSAEAPVAEGNDIANLATPINDPGGNLGHVWSNRPLHGQTFTTGSNPGGYTLHSVTMQNLNNSFAPNNATFTVRVGTVTGTAFTEVASVDSNNPITYAPLDYLTFHFGSPINLAPDTVYAFDWDTSGGGFVSTATNGGDPYAGGTAFSHGAQGTGNDANLTLHGFDRIFHLELD